MSIAVKELNKDLIHRANSNSFGGKRGDISEHEYQVYVERVLSWPISEEKKQSILDKLHEKWSEMLKYEAQHVSVMVAGPAKYNSRKLDKSDKILELSAAFSEWFKDLEDQIKRGQQKNDKAEKLLKLIEFCRKPDNPCDPTNHLAELAMYDNASFIRIYEELYPEYKWRKNSTIAKLYQKSLAGEIKEIRKEVFFEDANLTAYKEGDRVYIKFLMRPKRQLIVALKSRGWWWNSYKNAWSTYPDKLDPEWVESISEKRQNEAITQTGGMEMFPPVEEFAQQVARSTDAAITSCLDKVVGPGWELEKVEMERLPNTDPTKAGTRYRVSYDGKPVGKIRSIIAVQENKAIGNLYVEMVED